MEPHTRRIEYQRKTFSMRQVRDCVEGSDAIKRGGELYAPMPSGMRELNHPPSYTTSGQSNPLADKTMAINEAPWYHSNPAYSAYIHRAKFPDITLNTLRGLVGIASRKEPEIVLPSNIAYLEEVATIEGNDLLNLYSCSVSEIFQVGRHALVLDIRGDNTFYIAQYSSESYINWREEVIDGKKVQTYAEFETVHLDDNGEEKKKSLVYQLEQEGENGRWYCYCYKYTDGRLDDDGRIDLRFQGKALEFLPVVNLGAERNDPYPDPIPMAGISDCALDIYRHSADLNQNHFMTCNPTLVLTGVDEDDAPRVIGATVAIALSDPSSDAKYVSADASALGHVKEYIQDVFAEAVQYGAALLGPSKRAAESAEALSLRQAAAGATLVTIVQRCGEGIEKILNMAAELSGSGEAVFAPNVEFAELALSAQEITALLGALMSGAISRQTFLENMSVAGYIRDRTPEEEMDLVDLDAVFGVPPAEENNEPAENSVNENG